MSQKRPRRSAIHAVQPDQKDIYPEHNFVKKLERMREAGLFDDWKSEVRRLYIEHDKLVRS
jgi:hypothetical protein